MLLGGRFCRTGGTALLRLLCCRFVRAAFRLSATNCNGRTVAKACLSRSDDHIVLFDTRDDFYLAFTPLPGLDLGA
jgi:hypothetical protein